MVSDDDLSLQSNDLFPPRRNDIGSGTIKYRNDNQRYHQIYLVSYVASFSL